MNSPIPFMDRQAVVDQTTDYLPGKAVRNSINSRSTRIWLSGLLLLLLAGRLKAADFTITSPGFFYSINGTGPNPTLTLVRGKTYTFAVNAALSHPFLINSPGVVNNNVSSGTITYTVPTLASNYTYICSIHGFGGKILTIAPATSPPPTIKLLNLTVGNNLTVLSTGTNTWSVIPQFSTNLSTTNWFALTVLTNRFLNGTNETICGRPPGENVFIRIQSSPK